MHSLVYNTLYIETENIISSQEVELYQDIVSTQIVMT